MQKFYESGAIIYTQPTASDSEHRVTCNVPPWQVGCPACDLEFRLFIMFAVLSPHADRHARDILFTVCFCLCYCLCLSADFFCNGYLRLRLMQDDKNWQNGRPGWLAGRLPFWWTLAQGLASQGQKVKNFSNAHLVDRLRDRAEILQDGREAPTAGLRQVRWTLTEGLAPSEAKIEKSTMHWKVVNQVWQIGWRVASQVWQTGQWRELWRSACGDIRQFR